MKWSLYKDNVFLEPLTFSNNKTQKDVVEEVLEKINSGEKIIFIKGVCGTGKSAIALNIAKELGKTSVIVPGKNLQQQYKKDYEKSKYLLKENGDKLKISVITGRNNHVCKFLEDSKNSVPEIKEKDSKLHDIFSGTKEDVKETIGNDLSADNFNIPCNIEIREQNWNKIKKYLKQNKKVNYNDFLDIKDVKRSSVAHACPYWSPVVTDKYELKGFPENKKKSFLGLDNITFNIYQGKPGCSFYEQFNSYVDSDVIVFNSLKYIFESLLNRKPKTEAEIIDECDEFLDSFANQKNLNLDKVLSALNNLVIQNENLHEVIQELIMLILEIKKNSRIKDSLISQEIIPLKETGVYDLFKIFTNSQDIIDNIDPEGYLFTLLETIRTFDEYYNDTFVTFHKKEGNLIANLVTTNLEQRFKELIDKNEIIILMSGTLHSEKVLENIFGLKNFAIIEAETTSQGQINVVKTGLEFDCKYSNFKNSNYSREEYLKALDKSIEIAKKPALIHVNAFLDLPTEDEIKRYGLKNILSRDELKNSQKVDKTGYLIDEFKEGENDCLFTTRCSRGVDFPGEKCNSIVFTKYPNPNVQDAFWKILMKTKPQHYWEFYKDKAERELLQKVYRGLRFKEDKVDVLSPDSRVLDYFGKSG